MSTNSYIISLHVARPPASTCEQLISPLARRADAVKDTVILEAKLWDAS